MTVFSTEMLEIIKNFSQITNTGFYFQTGNELVVADGGGIGVDRNAGRTMLATGILTNEIDSPFAIVDPVQLYSALSMFDKPQVDVDSDTLKVIVSNNGKNAGKFVFNAGSPDVVKAPGGIKFPEDDNNISFRLSSDMYQRIFKGISVVSIPEISLYGQNGEMFVAGYDQHNKQADTFVVPVGETSQTFSIIVKVDNINKLMKQIDYDVTVSPKGMMRALASSESKIDVRYYLAGQYKHT